MWTGLGGSKDQGNVGLQRAQPHVYPQPSTPRLTDPSLPTGAPLPSQRKGVRARMVKQAVGLLKHIRAGFDGFVELAEHWTEKWPLFLISASQQSQDLRSHPFSHLRISGSFFFFSGKNLLYSVIPSTQENPFPFIKWTQSYETPLLGIKVKYSWQSCVTGALLDKIMKEGDSYKTTPVCGEVTSGTTELG